VISGLEPIAHIAYAMPQAYILSVTITALTFIAIGSIRSIWSPKSWRQTGLETLAIGTVAASVAYAAGDFLREII
jgi:VIT1/CCC1 family predicted Fe2+/Mn2+ transporter